MNNIHRVVEDAKGSKPSATALNKAFSAYQSEQRERLKTLVALSNAFAKITTYATPLHKFLAEWIMPYGSDKTVADQIGWYVARAPKLNFLPSSLDHVTTRMKWGGGEAQTEEERLRPAPAQRDAKREEIAQYKSILDELDGLKTTDGITSSG